jgi:hypothetical protein
MTVSRLTLHILVTIATVLFSPEEQKNSAGTWLRPATQDYIMFKNKSRFWLFWEVWVGPLGAQSSCKDFD